MLKSLLFVDTVYLCTFISVANNCCTIQIRRFVFLPKVYSIFCEACIESLRNIQKNFILQLIKKCLLLYDFLPKANSRVGYKTRKSFIPF